MFVAVCTETNSVCMAEAETRPARRRTGPAQGWSQGRLADRCAPPPPKARAAARRLRRPCGPGGPRLSAAQSSSGTSFPQHRQAGPAEPEPLPIWPPTHHRPWRSPAYRGRSCCLKAVLLRWIAWTRWVCARSRAEAVALWLLISVVEAYRFVVCSKSHAFYVVFKTVCPK